MRARALMPARWASECRGAFTPASHMKVFQRAPHPSSQLTPNREPARSSSGRAWGSLHALKPCMHTPHTVHGVHTMRCGRGVDFDPIDSIRLPICGEPGAPPIALFFVMPPSHICVCPMMPDLGVRSPGAAAGPARPSALGWGLQCEPGHHRQVFGPPPPPQHPEREAARTLGDTICDAFVTLWGPGKPERVVLPLPMHGAAKPERAALPLASR
jgi:hypothetical protein